MILDANFWAKVAIDLSTGCWEWTGAKSSWGYGNLTLNQRSYRAHRLAYEATRGPIPKGLDLDHLCRNRGCVNPEHLEAVTRRENLLRGDTIPASHLRRTHCKQGHPLSGDNLVLSPEGWRFCRTCRGARSHQLSERRKAARKLAR